MQKGVETTIGLVFAIVLLVVAVVLFWSVFNPRVDVEMEEPEDDLICRTKADCADSREGTLCLIIYQEDNAPFCGCLTSADCNTGSCGSDNRCY